MFWLKIIFVVCLTLLHSERLKLYGVLAVLSAIGLSIWTPRKSIFHLGQMEFFKVSKKLGLLQIYADNVNCNYMVHDEFYVSVLKEKKKKIC